MDVEPVALGEQRLGDQQPVGADDHQGCAEIEPGLGPVGLEHPKTEPLGGDLGGRRCFPAAPAAPRVGTRQQRSDLVAPREPFEHCSTERRRRRNGDPGHDAYLVRTSLGRSCAIASRRDSGSVRSMISVPSR